MLHTKNYRDVKDALERHGIELISGDQVNSGRTCLRVARKGVEAKIFAGLTHVTGRHINNLIRDAKISLKQRGAIFTKEELEEIEPPKRRGYVRLNMQERADFFALLQSGEDFDAACTAFAISESTGKNIKNEGLSGKLDDLMDEKYRIKKPPPAAPEAPKPEPIMATPNPMRQSATLLSLAGSAARAPKPALKSRPNPFDPRLLQLVSQFSEVQQALLKLQADAAEVGVKVDYVLDIDWEK